MITIKKLHNKTAYGREVHSVTNVNGHEIGRIEKTESDNWMGYLSHDSRYVGMFTTKKAAGAALDKWNHHQ